MTEKHQTIEQLFTDGTATGKPGILYVDDDVMSRDAMRRSLRPYRSQLRIAVAADGEDALQTMAAQQVDVVITDLKMPGMDGVSLLERIRTDWPDTVRLVLSGETDQVKILSSFGPAHKFFPKPTSPADLFTAVLDSLRLRRAVENPAVKRILMGIDALPYPEKYYLDLIAALRDDNSTNQSISAIIANNPVMAATAIRMANAPIYAATGRVATVRRAVQLLGFDHLQRLALATGLYQSGASAGARRREVEAISAQGLFIGQLAAQIALLEGLTAQQAETALTAGMLCPIGQLVLLTYNPSALADVAALMATEDLGRREAERALFNTTHAELGAHLLTLWGFPDALTECVLHHQDAVTKRGMNPAMRVVAAAYALQLVSETTKPS